MSNPVFTMPPENKETSLQFNKGMKLLGCPFCNSRPEIETIGTECAIRCPQCNAGNYSCYFSWFLNRDEYAAAEFEDILYEDRVRSMAERHLAIVWNTRIVDDELYNTPFKRTFKIVSHDGIDRGLWETKAEAVEWESSHSASIHLLTENECPTEAMSIQLDMVRLTSTCGYTNFSIEDMIVTEIFDAAGGEK